MNDFLVWCRLKKRTGSIIHADLLDTSIIEGGKICMRKNVTEIKYFYSWRNPFKKVTNAKKKQVPFIKHSNEDCKHREFDGLRR